MTKRQITASRGSVKAEAALRVGYAFTVAQAIATVRDRKRLASLLLSFSTQTLKGMARRSVRKI